MKQTILLILFMNIFVNAQEDTIFSAKRSKEENTKNLANNNIKENKDLKSMIKFYDNSLEKEPNKNGIYNRTITNEKGERITIKSLNYKDNQLDGEQKTFYRNGKNIKILENYENGTKISTKYFSIEANEIPKPISQELTFKGDLNNYINEKMNKVFEELRKIPENEIESENILIKFIVNEKGKTEKITSEGSIHQKINIMLKEIFEFSKWNPFIDCGETLKTINTFNFKINKNMYKFGHLKSVL